MDSQWRPQFKQQSVWYRMSLQLPKLLQCHPPLTCSDVKRTSCGRAFSPFVLHSGNFLCRATITAYRLEIAPPGKREEEEEEQGQCPDENDAGGQQEQQHKPGAKMESPCSKPMICRIFFSTSCSMRMKTGAISYVNLHERGRKVSVSLSVPAFSAIHLHVRVGSSC